MNDVPIILAFGTLVVSIGTQLLFTLKRLSLSGVKEQHWVRIGSIVGVILSVIVFGSAIWTAVIQFSSEDVLRIRQVWISLESGENPFLFALKMDKLASLYWIAVSLVGLVCTYFVLLSHITKHRDVRSSELLVIPFLTFGALLFVTSENFVTFYSALIILNITSYMAIHFSGTRRDIVAQTALRYRVLQLLPTMLIALGFFAIWSQAGSLSFEVLCKSEAHYDLTWALVIVTIGMLLQSLQIPIMQKWGMIPVFILGHMLIVPVFFLKLHPLLSPIVEVRYLAFIPLITALVSAGFMLLEKNPLRFVGWLCCYVNATLFLSGLNASYLALHVLSLTGILGVLIFSTAILERQEYPRAMQWFVLFSILVLTGIPGAGWAWGRYLEYSGLLYITRSLAVEDFVILIGKLVADLLFCLALWGIWRQTQESYLDSESEKKVGVFEYVGTSARVTLAMGVLSIGCLSICIGGRPFSGLFGSVFGNMFAFFPAPDQVVVQNYELISRILFPSIFLLSWFLGVFVLFPERKRVGALREKLNHLSDVVYRHITRDGLNYSLLWDGLLRPTVLVTQKAMLWFDHVFVESGIQAVSAWFVRIAKEGFSWFDEKFLDLRMVDGVATLVSTVGKSLRLIQNGQVQFYFAIGVTLMAMLVIRFLGRL